jgi:hypothetical protein
VDGGVAQGVGPEFKPQYLWELCILSSYFSIKKKLSLL